MANPERWNRFDDLPEDLGARLARLPVLFEERGVVLAYLFGSPRPTIPRPGTSTSRSSRWKSLHKRSGSLSIGRLVRNVSIWPTCSEPLRCCAFHVIHDGRLLYARDDETLNRFELDTLQQGVEGLERGREMQVDLPVQAGFSPVPACDRGPFLAHVARDQLTVLGQRERDGQRAVPGERADLDAASRSDQLDQERHERTLVGGDLHVRAREPCSFLTEAAEHLRLVDRHVDVWLDLARGERYTVLGWIEARGAVRFPRKRALHSDRMTRAAPERISTM